MDLDVWPFTVAPWLVVVVPLWGAIMIASVVLLVRRSRQPKGTSDDLPDPVAAARDFIDASEETYHRYTNLPPHLAAQQRRDIRKAAVWGSIVGVGLIIAAVAKPFWRLLIGA